MYASINNDIQNYGLDTLEKSSKEGEGNHAFAFVKNKL